VSSIPGMMSSFASSGDVKETAMGREICITLFKSVHAKDP
jgi:hypothetical protein